MKIKKVVSILFITFFLIVNSQNFDAISRRTEVYEGGSSAFYKDFNDILIDQNLTKCSQRQSEMFLAKIKINSENQAILTNEDSTNSCAGEVFSVALKEINKLKKWRPFNSDDNQISIMYYPIDYFENFKNGYTVDNLQQMASFPGGIGEFRNQFLNNFKFPKKKPAEDLRYEIQFDIDVSGNVKNVKALSKVSNPDYEKNIVEAISKIKQQWEPEKFRGVPIISKFRFPIAFPKD